VRGSRPRKKQSCGPALVAYSVRVLRRRMVRCELPAAGVYQFRLPVMTNVGNDKRPAMPAQLGINVERRFPEPVEAAAYYVVAEALTNAAKRARASRAIVTVDADDARVRLSVADDGMGGANPRGSGLIGTSGEIR
jgi:glucose-6-phosphate-specific signal transduction histidine kinase